MLAALHCTEVTSSQETQPERQPLVYEDFGTEVYRILAWELEMSPYAPEAKVAVLAENREEVIWALNRVIAPPVDTGLQQALEAILPHYDHSPTQTPCATDAACTGAAQFCDTRHGYCVVTGKIPRLTRRLQEILSMMGPGQFDALAKLAASHGAPPDAFNRLAYRLLSYEEELFGPVHRLVTLREGALAEILRWAHREIAAMQDSAPPVRPSLGERLLAELDSPLDTGAPSWAVLLDEQGVPVVNTQGGEPLAPFVDSNGDGLVDVDAENDPVDSSGQKIKIPVFSDESHRGETRDADGKAQAPGQPLYQYFDVKRTLLGAALWNLNPMLRDGILWDLFTAFGGLLGPKVTRSDPDGPFPGFDPTQNPILDLMYALREVRRYPRLPELAAVLGALARQHPTLLGELVTELGKAIALFEGPDRLTPGNNLFDDLHLELEYWAKTGLFREVLLSFQDPRMDGLAQGMFNMMVFTDLELGDPDQELACSTDSECQARIQQIYDIPYAGMTRWDQPDTATSNQSIQQKFMALVWDVFEVPVVIVLMNILNMPDMQITDDMASYYVEAMAGVAELSAGDVDGDLVVPFIPEFEDKYPSAEEFGLYMNHSHAFLGDPLCKQGYIVKDHLGRYLLGLQRTGALEGFKPFAEAFASLDDAHAFTRFLSVLHFHYGSTRVEDPTGLQTQHGTNFRALEEPLARTLSETDLMPKAIELLRVLAALPVALGGQPISAIDELAVFLTYMLDTDAGLTTRQGQTWIHAGDGVRRVDKLSRLYLLLHAFDRMDGMLEGSPDAKAAWDRMDLLGYFLDLDSSGQSLANPTAVPLLQALLPILSDHLAVSFAQPSYQTDLDEELADLESFFGSRGFAYLYDVVTAVRDDPAHAPLKTLVDNLLARITDASRSGDQDLFGAVLALLSDMIQSRIDHNAGKQLLRWVGEVISPDDRILFELVELLDTLYGEDTERVFLSLALNLFREQRPGLFAVNNLGTVLKAVHRLDPAERGHYTAEDFEHIITRLSDYLIDEERGLERLYTIVHNRN
jgi:hypothetical protein